MKPHLVFRRGFWMCGQRGCHDIWSTTGATVCEAFGLWVWYTEKAAFR